MPPSLARIATAFPGGPPSPRRSALQAGGRGSAVFLRLSYGAVKADVQTYLRNDLNTARLSGVIMDGTAVVAATGRGSHEPCRPSHPGGPEQPSPALLPSGTAPGAADRVR